MRKILLKLIIWCIRKYFPTTIKPLYCNDKVIMYRFTWSASVQRKDTSYTDLMAYANKLRNEIRYIDEHLKNIVKSIPKTYLGNYNNTKKQK